MSDLQLAPNVSQSAIDALRPTSFCRHNKLHFLLPASSADPNLFKAFVSSSILGYPIPTIINWGTRTNPDGSDVIDNMNSPTRRARQMEKLYSVAQYLDSLTDVHEDDLVLMTDSLDTWFQLPPSLLLSRYFAINARAQELILARLGPEAARNATQSIVFSAEKKCWPRGAEDMGCWAVPDSPLPKGLYGSVTDRTVEGVDGFRFIRPRYLNSGIVLGPVREARILFERAAQMAHADPEVFGADQGIIAQLFGEQEYMRESGRARNEKGREANTWKRGKMEDFIPEQGKVYEFGIGLDYNGALGLPTAHAENDSAWVTMSDREGLDKTTKAQGVTEPRVRRGLQKDIANLPRPFEELGDTNPPEAKKKSWSDVPLYTSLWTGVAPAIVHLNGFDDHDRKALREESWWRMWFAPYARQLFNIKMAKLEKSWSEEHLVAKQDGKEFYGTVPNKIVRQRGYGAETIDKDGQRGWLEWNQLCDEKGREEVFETGRKQLGQR